MPDDEKEIVETEKSVQEKKGALIIDPEKFKFTFIAWFGQLE